MSKARVSSKGQLTIPIEVRRRLGLERGDYVIFVPTERGVELRRVSQAIGELYGSLPPLKMPWKKARELAWKTRAEVVRRSSATRTSSSDS